MRMTDLIQKKKRGEVLTGEELAFFVNGYTRGEIPDYQTAAFLMAVCFRGMSREERAILTEKMALSGETVDLSSLPRTADKHSTGGVGDLTTLVTAPIAAAGGLSVAKMSGRGLGHTGGTVDKLESIPGFRTALTEEEFQKDRGGRRQGRGDHVLLLALRDLPSGDAGVLRRRFRDSLL